MSCFTQNYTIVGPWLIRECGQVGLLPSQVYYRLVNYVDEHQAWRVRLCKSRGKDMIGRPYDYPFKLGHILVRHGLSSPACQ